MSKDSEPPLDTNQAVLRLARCQNLLERIDKSGLGIHYEPTEDELGLLEGYGEVANAAASRPDGEGWFDTIGQRAGLQPSSIGLLSGVLRSHYDRHISPQARIEQLKRGLEGRL